MAEPTGNRAPTWRELWAQTADAVCDRAAARWLCETASAVFGTEFDETLDDAATARMVAHLDAMIERARAGEPLQYVLGHWGFRHLDLAVDRRVLIPRPETELVAGVAIELAATFGPIRTVADLGTGSGAIGLALADELPVEGTRVVLTDHDGDALDVARANLAGLGHAAANVHIRQGSWTDALPPGERFDVIVSNPPYVADGSPEIESIVSDWEPADALFAGPDGLASIEPIVSGSFDRLRPGGWLVLEIGADQGPAVTELLTRSRYLDVEIRPDLTGRDRIALGRRPVELFSAGDLVVRSLVNRLDDYALLLRWRRTPEVIEWVGGRDVEYDLAAILAKYGPGGEKERHGTTSAIVELDGRPVAFVQFYELVRWADDFDLDDGAGIWSLDGFVGEPELHDTGLGRRIVRATADHLLEACGADEVVIMPYADNQRAVAAYRAAGFVDDAVVPDHELHEGVIRDGLRMVYRPG